MKIGDRVPDFQLPAAEQGVKKMISMKDYQGAFVVLFYYPKDHTPFCTEQNCSFRDHMDFFELDLPYRCVVLGVSPDSVVSHLRFARKNRLPFPLISDEDFTIADRFGTRTEESLISSPAVQRITYLIDPSGVVERIYRVMDISTHVAEVVQDLRTEQQRWSRRE
ncbi:peroxiredoxin [Cohnella soli]|uniref:thioredoxin-dependent peroxiredoxin n=1 Tax=Cohnella soli TaxID=425005 RepID=A0ABW0I1A6_9BACL